MSAAVPAGAAPREGVATLADADDARSGPLAGRAVGRKVSEYIP